MSAAATRPPSEEELDQFDRSTKKKKGGDHAFTGSASGPVRYDDIYDEDTVGIHGRRSYKATVLGTNDDFTDQENPFREDGVDGTEAPYLGPMNLEIIEKKFGGYDCPEIVIPPHAEARLCKPWKQCLIVKLLGRHIGFKALENRINQLWVHKGVSTIIDLGSEFFMVYLSSEDDYEKALSNGPWMIYDHYLTVRPWKPNFRPEKEEIGHVTVWVRLPELPIEYYDADFLDFLGNRIGRTVKVDKTTEERLRGKFARLCVEVDLNKPLLAMFELKGHVYKIEYEGLHLLCMGCGKFGHYKDQCGEVIAAEGERAPVHRDASSGGKNNEAPVDGPWKVVQKQRGPRKSGNRNGTANGGGKFPPAGINGGSGLRGSRFNAFEVNQDIQGEVNEERGDQQLVSRDSRPANDVPLP